MGPVEIAIRRNVHEGDLLSTPSQAAPFSVGKISGDGVVLELGEKRTPTFFRWDCLEGIVPFLQQHGRVRVNGSGKSTEIVEGTLDGYLKQHTKRLTAGWVAALLEKASVVTIDRKPPAHISAALP
jgi:hypothetical protein